MIGDSKILTVSYGTFSCTLEGFDDPLNTMKAIAEYFRDLASDDRYFGAEPPTPDAAMLHRIAEREVSRMVEARVQDNSVFLRQHEASSQVAAPVAPAPTEAKPAAPTAEVPVAPVPAAAPAPVTSSAPVAAPEPDLPVLHDAIPDGVAAKLARIRQAVSYHPTPATFDEDVDQPIAPESHVVAEAPALDTAFDAEEDYLPEDFATNNLAADDFTPEAEGETEADAHAESAAAPALTSQPEVPVAEAPPGAPAEDMPALVLTDSLTDENPEDTAGVDDMMARLGLLLDDRDDADEDDATETTPEPMLLLADALVTEEDDDIVEEFAVLDAVDIATAEGVEAIPAAAQHEATRPATTEPATYDAEVETAALPERVDATDPQPGEAVAELYDEDEAPAPIAAEAIVIEEIISGAAAVDADEDHADDLAVQNSSDDLDDELSEDASDDLEAAPKRANARVIRIRRADGDDGEDDVSPADDPTRPFDSAGEAVALSRLMRQADDEMAGAENRRRLSAIAHLKAAVAATEAERAVTGEALTAPTAKIGPYRDDLAHAVQPEEVEPPSPVRPRREVSVRPQTSQRPGIRPGMMTAPPLVLVSEQRIDRTPPAGQPMVAVRPGRLSNAIGASAASSHAPVADDQYAAAIAEFDEDEDGDTDNIFSDDEGFAEFVQKLGLTSLTERLEAAAAFATIVENRDSFTRPQLMRRLSGGPAGITPSREDGLRSFGTLLRTGKIEKVRRGQYTLASDSPYLAEARRLAL